MNSTTESRFVADGDHYLNGRRMEIPDSFEVILGLYKGDPEVVRLVTGHLHAGGSTLFMIRNVSKNNSYVFPTDSNLRAADHGFILDWNEVATKIEFNHKAKMHKADQSQSQLDEYIFTELIKSNNMATLWYSEVSSKEEALRTSLVRYVEEFDMDMSLGLTDAREIIATAVFLATKVETAQDAISTIKRVSLGLPDDFQLPDDPEDLTSIRRDYWAANMTNLVMLLEARRRQAPLRVTIGTGAIESIMNEDAVRCFQRYSMDHGGEGVFVEWNAGGSVDVELPSVPPAKVLATALINHFFREVYRNLVSSLPEDGSPANELGVNEWLEAMNPV